MGRKLESLAGRRDFGANWRTQELTPQAETSAPQVRASFALFRPFRTPTILQPPLRGSRPTRPLPPIYAFGPRPRLTLCPRRESPSQRKRLGEFPAFLAAIKKGPVAPLHNGRPWHLRPGKQAPGGIPASNRFQLATTRSKTVSLNCERPWARRRAPCHSLSVARASVPLEVNAAYPLRNCPREPKTSFAVTYCPIGCRDDLARIFPHYEKGGQNRGSGRKGRRKPQWYLAG